MNILNRTCAFTGYRPKKLGFCSGATFDKLLDRLYYETEQLILDGIDIFITGMSLGVDIWAASTVLSLQRKYPHIKLCAAIPFEGQEKRWSRADQSRYHAILSKCASVKIVCADTKNINACYHIRNRFMVDRSSVLLAVYNPEGENHASGTKATVEYAQKQNKKVLIINPASLQGEKMLRIMFVCHGNICRSPMAEFILKDMAAKEGLLLKISSCATSTEEIGNPVYPEAKAELAKHGIKCEGKYAVQLTRGDYEKYDLFIGMDNANIRNMHRIFGGDSENKIRRLMDYGRGGEVSDPWYSGRFDITYRDIHEACAQIIKKIKKGQ